MGERRIKPGESHYAPFGGIMTPAEVKDAEVSPSPKEGQLFLMPAASTGLFRTELTRQEIKQEIDELLGRSDTIITPRRFTVLQFTNGRWETLVD